MSSSSEIITQSAIRILEAYSKRELSPVEVMKAHLEQCKKKNPEINAVFGMREEYALNQAEESEARWANGSPVGPLDGLPVLLKDSVKCIGFDYYHGSAGYSGAPATVDGPPAERIKTNGGLVYGKTTMPDFGMLAAGVSSIFGVIRNPWNPAVNTGGSSAGSGAAVAAGLAPLAVGTDIAGSVRLPCAHNGLVGLKPSRGRIPHLQPSPIRAAGPMARSVEDVGLLMSVLVLPDARDYESVPPCDEAEFRNLANTPSDYLAGKTIGLMLDMGFGQEPEEQVLEVIRAQVGVFENLGAKVELVPTVARFDPMHALYTLVQSRAYYELMSLPEDTRQNAQPYVAEWCRQIENMSAHDLSTAMFRLEDFKADVTEVLGAYDFVISPSLTVVSFPAEHVGAIETDHFAHCSYQIPFNQTGAPALSINAGFIDGLPVGMQIVGKRYNDLGVLKAAKLYEQNRGFDMNWPI
jgi:amidase/aspartyl-tRNA(Asn)/glutamyl-tRNA(Gln) amidotransferase subunit A